VKFIILAFALSISIALRAQPTITSFSPLSATAGSILTLDGTNFLSTPEENLVYFGLVKAIVNTASPTQLSVVVPTGASYAFITVTTGGLTGYSQKKFTLLLPGGPNVISTNSFTSPILNITQQTAGGFSATMADFDGDGKSDIFATRFGTLNVHRNTTTAPGQITFEKEAGSPAPTVPTQISTGDLSGDGRLDVVSANVDFGTNYISVWLNTTPSPGSPVSFSTRQDITTAPHIPFGVTIHDMNEDGKPDILIANYQATNDLTVLINTTTGNTFTYTTSHFAVTGGGGARRITVADFDGDGRPDVAIANVNLNRVHVLRNTTTGGTLTFATKVDLIPSNTIFDISSADMNADGRIEIITIGVNTPRAVSVFRNTSSGVGNINFAGRVDFTHPTYYTESITIHDVDGDSKPDLVASNYILKNTSSGTTISCEPAIAYEPTIAPNTTGNFLSFANDLDGDGSVEIIGFRTYPIGGTYYSGIVIQDYVPQPRISSINPTSVKLGETVTITGRYLSTVTGVKFGDASEVTSFTINSTTSIAAIVADATSGNIIVNSPVGPDQIGGFTLIPGPSIISFTPNSGPVGTIVTINGANFGPSPADNRVFFGSVQATVNEASSTTIKAIVPAGYSEVPIAVGFGIQTATTARPFQVTFSGGLAPFGEKSLSNPIKIGEGFRPFAPAIGDFNGDNKPDIAAIGTGGIQVFFNTTTNGLVTMSNPLTLAVPSTPLAVTVADVDGDGMQDIVTSGATVCVFLNTSTPENNSFATAKPFPQLSGNSMTMGDIDGDGRPDIVSSNPIGYVARNLSHLGNINFASPVSLPGNFSANSFAIADLDQDGRSEIVMPVTSQGLVNVYPNVSTPAILSLLSPIQVAVQELPDCVSISDLDGNSRPEIVVLSKTTGKASAVLNGSTSGLAFSDGAIIDLGVMPSSGMVALGDINGDGTPDIALSNNVSLINLAKNTTPIGGIFSFETFSKPIDFFSYIIEKPILVDLDGNGELDIVGGKITGTPSTVSQTLTILRNQINEPYIDSFAPTRVGTGSTVKILGENFSSVVGVAFGDTEAASFQIVSATEIIAVVGDGDSGDVSVTNGHFVSLSPGFTFFNGPLITSFSPTSASKQEVVTITGLQFSNASGVSFGEIPAASFSVVSPTSITATPALGASGKVKVSNLFDSDELDGFTYIAIPDISSFTPTRAGTGSIVTISGQDFSVVTGVLFGGSPATSFEIISNTIIKAVIGSGASGDVSVTDGNFESTRPGFVYYNGPIISSFAPTSASKQEVVTITGIQFIGASGVSFGGVPAASFSIVSPTSIRAIPASGASGNVKVSNSFGSDEASGFTYIVVTGIESERFDIYAVESYPNPSSGHELGFKLNDVWNGKEIDLIITDITGKPIVSKQMMVDGNNLWITLPGQRLTSGVYLLLVKLNERTVVKKFFVSR